jgi:hypothetical protein
VSAPSFADLPIAELNLATVREYGGRLHAVIFSEEIERSLESARYQADASPVALQIEAVGELDEHPWEWLFDPETKRFLALTYRTSLTKWKQPSAPPRPSSIPPRTLRVTINAETVDEDVLALARDWVQAHALKRTLDIKGVCRPSLRKSRSVSAKNPI